MSQTLIMLSHGVAYRWALIWGGASLAVALAIALALTPYDPRALFAATVAASLLCVGLGLGALRWWRRQKGLAVASLFEAALAHAPHPACLTDPATGRVIWQNAAAGALWGVAPGHAMAELLGDWLADGPGKMAQLHDRLEAQGVVQHSIVTRRGAMSLTGYRHHGGLHVWQMVPQGRGFYLSERDDASPLADLPAPVLRVDAANRIISMNAVARSVLIPLPQYLTDLFHEVSPTFGELCDLGPMGGQGHAVVLDLPVRDGARDIALIPVPDEIGLRPVGGWTFDDLPVATVRLKSSGEVVAVNRLARNLLSVQPGQRAQFSNLVEGLGRPVADWLQDAVAGRSLNRPEVLRISQSNADRYVQVTLRKSDFCGPGEVMGELTDATALRTLEEQFVQSQKMEAIGQLAGGIAHDFNNLLTAINGYCDLLLLRHDTSDPDYPDLVQIQQNANRAASLVRQLLAFSRKQTMQPEVLDLGDTMSELSHLLNRLVGQKITLTFRHDDNLGHIRADKRQLEQVIVNLVVNARDAMPMGGEIRLETEAVVLTQDLVRDGAVVAPGSYAVIRVVDEGVGIPADRLPRIFQPFYTTKRTGEGTGLGLSTAYGIVKQSGGFIFADSLERGGSIFTLYFAVHRQSDPDPDTPGEVHAPLGPPQAEIPPAIAGGVILLVEDEAPVRAFASRALQMRGHTVLEADSGEAALHLLADPTLHIDLFVSDVSMPGLDGPAWVGEARRDRPDVKVVFISGYAQDSAVAAQTRIENAEFLGKPFSLMDLTSAVARSLS
ncbi:ATP-binding protein [Roseicitreum antarcticum]|uniref:ATP-binding protein n=1 Tax=Roseicitreum antarcticum TaxID=564137 RepID=UPI001CC1CF57|nr:ATP-binding protein [Roseicitreum antarcticum]